MADNPDLDRLLKVAEHHARAMLVRFGVDELTPIFHLVCPGSHDYVVATPFSGDKSKDEAARMIRERIRDTHATAYMFLSEAWMIERGPGFDPSSQRPKDASDRIEVVIAIATDGVNYRMRRWRIKRGPKGQCIDLVLDSKNDDKPVAIGRFDNLFPMH